MIFCWQSGGTQGRLLSIAAFIHAALVLFPMVAWCIPDPVRHGMGTGILQGLIQFSDFAVAPCAVVLQFVGQILEQRAQHSRQGALSLVAVLLQMIVFAAVAFRWFLRLGPLDWKLRWPTDWWDWQILYSWIFASINYALHALGCAILLACYAFWSSNDTEGIQVAERSPLLG
jgi:hypothetical protein